MPKSDSFLASFFLYMAQTYRVLHYSMVTCLKGCQLCSFLSYVSSLSGEISSSCDVPGEQSHISILLKKILLEEKVCDLKIILFTCTESGPLVSSAHYFQEKNRYCTNTSKIL